MPETLRKFLATVADDSLAEKRQVLVYISGPDPDRDGDVVVQAGIDTASFMSCGGTVLWQHDPMQPIARCLEIGPRDGRTAALTEFPEAGVSPKADEVYGLIKAGVVNTASIGFIPVESEPIDAKKPWAGKRYSKIKLMEFSFVSVPANAGATVIARSGQSAVGSRQSGEVWKVGASRNLPIGDDAPGDAAAAILAKAGFGSAAPDFAFARKGFLVYDSANPKFDAAYAHPFARVIDGRLTVTRADLNAAAAGLAAADLPDEVRTKARAVVALYEVKMNKQGAAPKIKGLYDVAMLAELLTRLGYLQSSAVLEAEIEGDSSPVPAMLADALKRVAEAFLAMSAEEVAELLEGRDVEIEDDVEMSATPQRKRLLSAVAKAGRAISGANAAHVEALQKCIASLQDCQVKALDAHAEASDHMQAFAGHLAEAGEHAKALAEAAKPKPKPAETPDPDDDEDVELAATALERKRMVEIARLAAAP